MVELLQSKFIQELGATALMFIVFYLVLQFNKASIESLIRQQSDFVSKMFELYNKLLDTTVFNSSMLQKIDDKIKNGQWCPFTINRKTTKQEKEAE
ncbi:hypothetical protein IJ732_04230 [bacterium]|nr:hypothetical protein [bacterium]